jgi:hypothetical protein
MPAVVAAPAAGGESEDERKGGEPGDAHPTIVAHACSQIVSD